MVRVKFIRNTVDILMYTTMIVFIVLLFCTFQLRLQFDFLYQHLWLMFIFPIFSAWLVFARNRLIDYFNADQTLEADQHSDSATSESTPVLTVDKDKS
ncbi:hypothetical protein L3V82_05995 [Thiotrichales bacterium 19S3-7]|nr:hypothetical protein [Thiotrichales bacterium 19S3-7]MCF6801647.1 hypothetical protein [Thiotrichales bacterium 19S3-11]